LLVKLDGAGSVADSHIWSNGVETLRYAFGGHDSPPKDEKIGRTMLHQNAETVCQRSGRAVIRFQSFKVQIWRVPRELRNLETLKL
jgi:hypothetical protein